MITRPNVKINLGLNVLRKRKDGFHDLETLFVPYLGIADVLEIVTGDDYSRTLSHLVSVYGGQADEEYNRKFVQAVSPDGKVMITIARAEGVDWNPLEDLTVKAYNVLDEEFGLPPVKMFLEKMSPVGAGLGGGSSDAAFALKMLDSMFGLSLTDDALAKYAARIGSDCAFFVYNRPMFGRGRGEILEDYPLEGIDYGQGGDAAYELQVVVPEGVSVSTAQAYGGICPAVPAVSLEEVLKMPVESWKGHLVNDFEKPVFAVHPALAAVKDSIYDSGALYASMSGSGSALFGIYRR